MSIFKPVGWNNDECKPWMINDHAGDEVQSCDLLTPCLETKVFSFESLCPCLSSSTSAWLWQPISLITTNITNNLVIHSQVFLIQLPHRLPSFLFWDRWGKKRHQISSNLYLGVSLRGSKRIFDFDKPKTNIEVQFFFSLQIYRHDLDILKTRQRVHQTSSESWFPLKEVQGSG